MDPLLEEELKIRRVKTMELCRDYMASVEGHKDVSKSQIGESAGRTFKRLPSLDSKELLLFLMKTAI